MFHFIFLCGKKLQQEVEKKIILILTENFSVFICLIMKQFTLTFPKGKSFFLF